MLKAVTVAVFSMLLSCAATAPVGDWYDDEYSKCREGTTVAIVRCVDRLTEAWQTRLDQAYQALLARQGSADRRDTLDDAQRLWHAFRQANCTFYGQGPGTIASVEAAECRRVLTRRRALELEQAAGAEPQ
ncbi:lysozyme inhibitor LprI family protein [Billgrantia sp. LNSP4103-1]|uniref:lysozyme inhibitor LprI family protein n=1 Tax=Billgrantia sp. LNSP4103-1 TaxID=3410266 RepID=UPI00403F888E